MINCTIVKGSNRERADGFIEGTKRIVCLPDIEASLLSLVVETPCHMQVVVNEEVILSRDLTPKAHLLPLREFLYRPVKQTGRKFFFARSQPKPELVREFSVVLRQGHRHGHVLGTYEFSLLSCDAFEDRFNSHMHLHDCRCAPEFFTTDARAAETAKNCWNCESPVRPGDICRNCGCDQDHH